MLAPIEVRCNEHSMTFITCEYRGIVCIKGKKRFDKLGIPGFKRFLHEPYIMGSYGSRPFIYNIYDKCIEFKGEYTPGIELMTDFTYNGTTLYARFDDKSRQIYKE